MLLATIPPDVMYVRRTPDVMPVRRTPDVTPVRRTPDVTPVRRTPDVTPVRRTPDVTPVRRTPDVMPRPAETTDDVVPVQRANWHANHNQFHATLESNGLCSYHNKFGNRARKCISGCRWFSKNFTSGRFTTTTSFEADSATRPSQAGFFIKDELSDYRFLVLQVLSVLSCLLLVNTINHPSSSDLVAANGTSIRTYGEQQVNIRLSGQAYT